MPVISQSVNPFLLILWHFLDLNSIFMPFSFNMCRSFLVKVFSWFCIQAFPYQHKSSTKQILFSYFLHFNEWKDIFSITFVRNSQASPPLSIFFHHFLFFVLSLLWPARLVTLSILQQFIIVTLVGFPFAASFRYFILGLRERRFVH